MSLKNFALAIFLLTALAVGEGNDEIPLSPLWRVQPAQNAASQPDGKAWRPFLVSGNESRLALPGSASSAWQEQSFDVPASWADSRAVLDFRRIEGDALLFLNGRKVGELLRPGGEIDVSEALKPGASNLLRVFITKSYDGISRGFEEDLLRNAARTQKGRPIDASKWSLGVTAPVSLLRRANPAAIARLDILTSWRKKEISFAALLDSAKELHGLSVKVEVFGQDGKLALSAQSPSFAAPAGKSSHLFQVSWPEAIPWELDKAYLYTAQASLLLDGKTIEIARPERFGFREVWVDGRKILLNGHEVRFRLSSLWNVASAGAGQVDFMRLMGYDAGYIQAHAGLWWGSWNESPLYDEDLLRRCDETGYALFLPSPSARAFANDFTGKPALQRELARETELFVARYRNHPALLGWMVSMNGLPLHGRDGVLYRDAQRPEGLGHRFTEDEISSTNNLKCSELLCRIVKKADPSRLAFAHAEGGIGEIATANLYLNFAPLQEREDWPLLWSRSGEMPFMMVEAGQPHIGNFWKGKRFLLTEYLAMYFGDQAYVEEPESLLAKTVANGLAIDEDNQGENTSDRTLGEHPLYWAFQRLFVRNSNRSWRSWGVNGGWSYWLVATHYGLPPEEKPGKNLPLAKIYNKLEKGLAAKPAWVNPNFDIHSQANKPFLAYLAGWPLHTDKTHGYYEGERVEKAVSVVWDGPGSASVTGGWQLKNASGKTLLSGSLEPCELAPGAAKLLPILFTAPTSGNLENCILELSPFVNGTPAEKDEFALDFRPRPKLPPLKSKLAVFDPLGQSSAWLKECGVDGVALKGGESLEPFDILLVGREALKPGERLPFSTADLERGLNVLLLEQRPEVWHGLGFRTTEAMPRIVFPGEKGSPVLKGLASQDLRYWRGASTLLPAGRNQPSETVHAPKWTNTHAIASSVPQLPRVAGFTPHLSAEFDMDYSPLLEWRCGKGLLLFSSLDFTGRVGRDPAATALALNLLQYLDGAKLEPARKALFSGNDASRTLLAKLGVDFAAQESLSTADPKSSLLLLGHDPEIPKEALLAFAEAGGNVLCLPQSAEWLSGFGVKTSPSALRRGDASGCERFRGLGPKLLRWRDALDGDFLSADAQPPALKVYASGAFGVLTAGPGKIVFCQVSPSQLLEKEKGRKDKEEAVDLSVIRLEQLLCVLLNFCGAQPSRAVAARLNTLAEAPHYFPLGPWRVLGPFAVSREDGAAMLSVPVPEEAAILAGAERAEHLAWSPLQTAGANGYLDLAPLLKRKSLATALAVCQLDSDCDRDAVLRLGCDWRMALWMNGKEVFRTLDGKNKPNAYRVNVSLKKGRNVIVAKIGSGSSGFSFYAEISGSAPGNPSPYSLDLRKDAVLYGGALASEEFDPYLFRYW